MQFCVRDIWLTNRKELAYLLIDTNFNNTNFFIGKHFLYGKIVYEINAVIPVSVNPRETQEYGIRLTNDIQFTKVKKSRRFRKLLKPLDRYSFALSQSEINRYFI